jgi:hypothetical protein
MIPRIMRLHLSVASTEYQRRPAGYDEAGAPRACADSFDERIREIRQGKRLLFDEFARKSEAKDADRRAVDTFDHRPEVLDDESVPVAQRVLAAERHRLGLDR